MMRRTMPRSVAQRLANKMPKLFGKKVILKGLIDGEPTDNQLLDAWRGIPTSEIEAAQGLGSGEGSVSIAAVNRARRRVLELRRKLESQG